MSSLALISALARGVTEPGSAHAGERPFEPGGRRCLSHWN